MMEIARHDGDAAIPSLSALRQNVLKVYQKKVRCLMRVYDLHPKMRRHILKTTDGDRDQPIFPNFTKEAGIDGPLQVFVANITYLTTIAGFFCVAGILDAWSRRSASPSVARSMRV